MSTIQPAIRPAQHSRGAGAAAGSWRQVAALSRYFPASTWLAGMPSANRQLPSAGWKRMARPGVTTPGWVRAAVMPPSRASRPPRS